MHDNSHALLNLTPFAFLLLHLALLNFQAEGIISGF